jgi:hypothetical protein
LADCCEHGNEASGSIKSEEFLGSMQNYCQKKQNGGKVHELEIVWKEEIVF